jgi:hypothetical protein
VHEYRQQYDDANKEWDCYVDTTLKFERGLEEIGMSGGVWYRSAGEGHQDHVQLGKMAPDKLSLYNLKWRTPSTGHWTLVDGVPFVEGGPYGVDEIEVGWFKLWTNPH